MLRGLEINRVNQVWATDITYIPMARGFLYLVAIMDWHSRYVLAWRLSNTLEVDFCVAALEEALSKGRPQIFNTDQGSQFTSEAFTSMLLAQGVQVSMDGRGRCMDNVFVERLWRSIKYEEVYLKAYQNGTEARKGIGGGSTTVCLRRVCDEHGQGLLERSGGTDRPAVQRVQAAHGGSGGQAPGSPQPVTWTPCPPLWRCWSRKPRTAGRGASSGRRSFGTVGGVQRLEPVHPSSTQTVVGELRGRRVAGSPSEAAQHAWTWRCLL